MRPLTKAMRQLNGIAFFVFFVSFVPGCGESGSNNDDGGDGLYYSSGSFDSHGSRDSYYGDDPFDPYNKCYEYEPLTEWPDTGFMVYFMNGAEHSHVWVNSVEGKDQLVAFLQDPQDVYPKLVMGPIEKNSQYNPGRSWRHIPSEVVFGDIAFEICDAATCALEDPNSIIFEFDPPVWCPWGTRIMEIYDCRDKPSGDPCPSVWKVKGP